MSDTNKAISAQEKRLLKFGLSKKFIWQAVFSWCLMLEFSSIFCLFLEGKSSIDMAFTLWDDRYAKVWMEPMGNLILPQILFYAIFFLITGILTAFVITRRWFKQMTVGILLITSVLIILLTACYGIVQLTYLGARQGPAGWLILEYPWLSLTTFLLSVALGLIGLWTVIIQDLPAEISNELTSKGHPKNKSFLILSGMWYLRGIIIIGMILGSILLVAGLILLLNNINVVFFVGMGGLVSALGLILFKKDIFPQYCKKRKEPRRLNLSFLKLKNMRLFDEYISTNDEIEAIKNRFIYSVNPRNRIWRPFRNALNCIFIALCMAFVAAMCFMTVPDEWIFIRFFELIPWVLIGIAIGIILMAILPEPMIYSPLALIHVIVTYNQFLGLFEIPFLPEFIALNGIFMGFWVSVFVMYHIFINRMKEKNHTYLLMFSAALTFGLVYLILNFVARFQHNGQMVQGPITEYLNIFLPFFVSVSGVFLIIFVILWRIDLLYRMREREKLQSIQPALQQKVESKTILQKSPPAPKKVKESSKNKSKLTPRRRKALSLALLGILIGSFVLVEITYVNNSTIQPLLIRNDTFGIWTVSGVTKVEKHYPIQMPTYAPEKDQIEISAARGEWEGFHLMISPQPGKKIDLTNVKWSDFSRIKKSDIIDSESMEIFLVSYLVDEQPDQLNELPKKVKRSAGEHIDLFCRVRIPKNASSGDYESKITLEVNDENYEVSITLTVFDFILPKDRHLRNAFGGGWQTEEWYDELEYLRISQYDMGIPFEEGEQYWWNSTSQKFDLNWTAYDVAFQSQLDRGFTGIRQGYIPLRPEEIDNDDEWEDIVKDFVNIVSDHLESKTWFDELGEEHSWVEIPYYYWIDEPPVEEYPYIKEVNDLYHSGTSKLRTLLTEEYRKEYSILQDCIDIWCPVIGNFEPSAVENRHKADQEYWFYVCVAPTAPYPNLQLWEAGHDPRLLPLICARFNADGFLYWSMTASNDTYRAGFDGNGDGQVAFEDPKTERPLPSLRLLSYCAGVEDFEYIWLMRLAVENKDALNLPDSLVSKAEKMEDKLKEIVGARPQFVDHDVNKLLDFRNDLATLLEDLWPYVQDLYA